MTSEFKPCQIIDKDGASFNKVAENKDGSATYTRDVPDVPELVIVSHEVFYAPTREWRKTSLPDYYRNNDNLVRDLVDKDQAAAVIAAKDAEIERLIEEAGSIAWAEVIAGSAVYAKEGNSYSLAGLVKANLVARLKAALNPSEPRHG